MSNGDPAQGGARILVGVDGSDDGLRAALYAMREARAAGSSLWLVNVADDSGLVVNGLWDLLETPAQLSEIGERILAETVDVLVKAGFPAERIATEVVVGRATDALAELSGRAALAVVGRRAISGLERMFVGSTSVGLAAGAACPVVVISAAATPNRTGHFGTVAVAVSGWPPHSAALDWAVREAAVRTATLLVVHAIPETADAVGRFAEIADSLERHVAALREQHPGTSIETRVREGSPIDELVAVSDEADLLIVGLHSAGPLSGLVRGLMAHAHCPVGLVR